MGTKQCIQLPMMLLFLRFIYSSKEWEVWMPAYMTNGVVTTVECVSVCVGPHTDMMKCVFVATCQAHSIDSGCSLKPEKSFSSKLAAFSIGMHNTL